MTITTRAIPEGTIGTSFGEEALMTTITSREFNRDVSAAKRAAAQGPVTITDHGRPAHVLLTIDEYNRITGAGRLVGDRWSLPGFEHIELDIPPREIVPERDFDL